MRKSAQGLVTKAKGSTASSATRDLRRRVASLEAEVQEARALNLRVAELADLMTELLIPLAQRDEDKLQELLTKYHESL